jgi:hypothetical protein
MNTMPSQWSFPNHLQWNLLLVAACASPTQPGPSKHSYTRNINYKALTILPENNLQCTDILRASKTITLIAMNTMQSQWSFWVVYNEICYLWQHVLLLCNQGPPNTVTLVLNVPVLRASDPLCPTFAMHLHNPKNNTRSTYCMCV